MIPTNNRELSWLAFNERVLQEAQDPSVPLMQRLRFLGIFSSNQDEFIKVRLARLLRMSQSKSANTGRIFTGRYTPQELLPIVTAKIKRNQRVFTKVYQGVLAEMAEHGIRVLNETQLTPRQRNFCRDFFARSVSSTLVPLLIDDETPLPLLRDNRIYHGVRMVQRRQLSYAIIRIPLSEDCPRFIQLPSSRKKHDIIFIDDVIRLCLDNIFFMFNYQDISAHTFKIMRDAELNLAEDVSTSLVEKIKHGLEERLKGSPAMMVYDPEMPTGLLELLVRKLNVPRSQLTEGTRYHVMRDLMKFPRVAPELEVAETPPLPHHDIVPFSSILKVIRKKDLLLNYPYQTFNHFVDFLCEAAIDPKVTKIYITLYRTAEHSKIVNALVNAAYNGKQVVVLVELMARFDEEQNLETVNTLQESGVKVLHGLRGLKIHSKLVLVERQENKRPRGYLYVGTGNFNESTAKLYGDFGLFTAHPGMVEDARSIFTFLETSHKHVRCRYLLAAPFFMRQRFARLIFNEIRQARLGLPAHIYAKCNTLTDVRLITLLYRASRAGVDVRLVIRGACALQPQVKGLSENIQCRSIVDKFLEHSRVFIFGNNGDEKVFISSADWMTRNLDQRLEVAAPILDPKLKQIVRDFFDYQWADNVKARDQAEMGLNTYVSSEDPSSPPRRAQTDLYEYYKELNEREKLNADAS